MTDAEWTAKQRAFVAERDARRARPCECGHRCDDHVSDGVAYCSADGCKCGSFRHKEAA
jgi:hypothetical protein